MLLYGSNSFDLINGKSPKSCCNSLTCSRYGKSKTEIDGRFGSWNDRITGRFEAADAKNAAHIVSVKGSDKRSVAQVAPFPGWAFQKTNRIPKVLPYSGGSKLTCNKSDILTLCTMTKLGPFHRLMIKKF